MTNARRSALRKNLPRTESGQLSRSLARFAAEAAHEQQQAKLTIGELRAARARALGLSESQAASHISETIAGRMALRGVLTRVEAEAIDHYAALVRRALRCLHAPANTRCSLNLAHGGDPEEDIDAYIAVMRAYNEAFFEVKAAGYRVCLAINIIVRDLCEPTPADIPLVKRGAKALVKHFGLDQAAAA